MLAPSADLSDERQEPSCSTLDHLVELIAQMGVDAIGAAVWRATARNGRASAMGGGSE